MRLPMTRDFFGLLISFKNFHYIQSMKVDTVDDMKATSALISGHDKSAALALTALLIP